MLVTALTFSEIGKNADNWHTERKAMVRYLLSQNNTAAPVNFHVQKQRISSAVVISASNMTRARNVQTER